MTLWMLILLMAVATYASRAMYLLIPESRVPLWLARNLDLIPIVVLSSMIGPALLVHRQPLAGGTLTSVVAAAFTAGTLRFTRSAGAAVLAGVLSHIALKLLLAP